jgi:hypothetical protein
MARVEMAQITGHPQAEEEERANRQQQFVVTVFENGQRGARMPPTVFAYQQRLIKLCFGLQFGVAALDLEEMRLSLTQLLSPRAAALTRSLFWRLETPVSCS